jgi:dihydroxy-acid dehydratase
MAGGPIALIKEGDLVRIDTTARRIDLKIDAAEFERRRAAWTPRKRPTPLAGVLEKYASQVGSAHLGAVTHSGNLQWDFEAPE